MATNKKGYMNKYWKRKGKYKKYHGTTTEKKKRAGRNKARRIMNKAGKVRKGDGKHVDHINRNARDNRVKNLRVVSRKNNLSRKKR